MADKRFSLSHCFGCLYICNQVSVFWAVNPLWTFISSVPPKDIDWPPFIVALLTLAILVLVLHSLIRLIVMRRAKFEIQNLVTRAETLSGEAGAILASYPQMEETFKRERERLEKQYRQRHEEYERRDEEIEQEWNRKMAEAERRGEEIEQEWNSKSGRVRKASRRIRTRVVPKKRGGASAISTKN